MYAAWGDSKSCFTRVLKAVSGFAGNQDQGEKFNGLSADLVLEESLDEFENKLAKTPVGSWGNAFEQSSVD